METHLVYDGSVGLSLQARVRLRISLLRRRLKSAWGIYRQDRLAVLGLVLIALFALMAVLHPILMATVWPRRLYDPATGFDPDLIPHPSPPSSIHLFGTDVLGRDVLSMLLAATTPTFTIGFTAAIIAAVLATALSIPAAYYRGRVDTVLSSVMDIVVLLPAPILMIIIGARMPRLAPVPLGMIYGVVFGLGAAAIVMRSEALKVSTKPFMEAAHVSGGSSLHVMSKHFLPNMLPLAALQMMLAVSGAIIADGFISFFGLRRVTSNWGTMIYDGFLYATIGGDIVQWHMLLPPAMCFWLFALAFYLVARGLRRIADPRTRSEL